MAISNQKSCSLRTLSIFALSLFWATQVFAQYKGYQRSVKDFGAIGDGIADGRKAIQAAIDDVAQSGGGVFFFPVGTYKLTIYTPPVGQFPWHRALTIKSNVSVQGVNFTSGVIKLADNQIPYGALLAPQPPGSRISNFAMCDLSLDTNALNNPLPTDAEIRESVWEKRRDRNTIFFYDGNALRLERCRFSNFIGVWSINLYSYRVSDVGC